jgi:hypothetical protein
MDGRDAIPQPPGQRALIGFLPSLEGIPKTSRNYPRHQSLINSGDICYTFPGTLLAAGRHFAPWNFSAPAEAVNDHFSRVIFFLPCRIAPPPHDEDGFPFAQATRFVAELKIPCVTVSESIQSSEYDYDPEFHRRLRPAVVRYLHTLADHSAVVGTRGAYSAEVLKKLGIRNVEVVGCPSLYINGPALHPGLVSPRPFSSVRNVAVCYSNYQLREESRIRDVLAHATRHHYHYVEQSFNLLVKALHYPGFIEASDLRHARKVFHGFREIQELFRAGRVHYFTNYHLWKEFLGTMDFVFGARMHGLTPALQCGVRSLFIAHDARVREMCEFFDLPFLAERDLPATLEAEDLYNRCDYTAATAGYPARYQAFLAFLARNGVHPNCDAQGRILDYWEPEPAPEVVRGETCIRSAFNGPFFDQLCALGEELVKGTSPELEARIRELGQAWYQSRIAIGEPN